MKTIKSFAVAVLSMLCMVCFAISTVGFISTKKASAAAVSDKTLSYSLSCYNADGAAKGSLSDGGTWAALTKAGAKKSYVNIIFGSDSRYITFTFTEAISAEEYVSIDFGMNFFGGSTLTNQSEKAQIYKPNLVDGVVSGTSRTDTDVEVNAGWYVDSTNGNAGEMNVAVNYVSIPTAAIKHDDGLVYGFTIRCAAEASGGAHYAVMSDLIAKAVSVEEPATEEPATTTLDFNLTEAWFELDGKKVTGQDTDDYAGLFGGDGSTKITYTSNIADKPVTVKFGKTFVAEYYDTVELKVCIGNWTEGNTIVTTGYALSDTEFVKPLCSITTTGKCNKVDTLTFEAADLADEDGKISGFVIKKSNSVEGATGQIFADYVRINLSEKAETLRLQAGNLVCAANPRSIQDDNVTWAALVDHGKPYDPYGYVEHPAFKTYSKEKFPDFELIDEEGTNSDALICKNVVQALNIGPVKASNFARLEITFMFTDWLYGAHEFYVYGEKTTAFTDAEGNPTGYVAKMTAQGPSTKFTFKIDNEKLAELADASGKIQYVYIMYGKEIDNQGVWNGAQLWVNEVNLIIPEDMPNPVVSEEYTSKDVSELLPIGTEA